MSTSEYARFTALQDTTASCNVKIIATSDIRINQPNDTIFFKLPGQSDTIWAEASLISDDSVIGFQWSGKLLNRLGYISLLYHNGLTSGYIQSGYDYYELMPMNTTYQFFVRRNNNQIKSCVSPSITPPPDITFSNCSYPSASSDYNICPALISVLLVITDEAKNWILTSNFGSIEEYVLTAQATVNQAFYNSDIPNKEIRITWIEKDISPFLSLNIDEDRELLPLLIGDDRDAMKADIAILLTEQGYDGVAGAVTNFGPSIDEAFAVIEAPYFISQFTLAHEIGHLFGCRHNWAYDFGNDNTNTCAHAKRFLPVPYPLVYDNTYEVDTWSTIVGAPVLIGAAYPINDGIGVYYLQFTSDMRILHYSNPNVYFGTEITGRANNYIANNSRYIRNEACTVADFYPTRELGVFVIYALTSPCLTTNTFSANIFQPESGIPGQPPYTVRWFWNNTGYFSSGNPGTFLGQGQNINISPYPACPVFWLKCEVISSDGVRVSRIRKISIGSINCCSEVTEEKTSALLESSKSTIRELFPNPVIDGCVNLTLLEALNAKINFRVMDIIGHILSEGDSTTDIEGHFHVDVNNFEAGAYLLHLRLPAGESQTFKFIIAQN